MQTANPLVAAKLNAAYNNATYLGQVLDVSGVRLDGTGTRRVDYPATLTGTRKWVGVLPIISNNYDSYAFVVRTLNIPDAEVYAQNFLDSYGAQPLERQLNQNRPAPASPFPATRGALIVPTAQVTVRGARSPAKRGGPAGRGGPGSRGGRRGGRGGQVGQRVLSPRVGQAPQQQFVPAPQPQRTFAQAPQPQRTFAQAPQPQRTFAQAPQPQRTFAQAPQPFAQAAPRVPSPPRTIFQGGQQALTR